MSIGPLEGKQEAFARNMAKGLTQADAAREAGYSASRAASTGCVLAKKKHVRARIKELSARIDSKFAELILIDKSSVLQGIAGIVNAATKEGKYGDALRGYELLGKNLRLFDRAMESIGWNGDPGSLSDEQLDALMAYLERLVPADRLEAAKQRAALEAGTVIDVIPEEVENKAKDEW